MIPPFKAKIIAINAMLTMIQSRVILLIPAD